MRTVIKQIVGGSGDSQTIRMVVKDSERGAEGPQGVPGEAATISAGQAYSLPAGSNPYVENTGTSSTAVFDFYIPKGETGATGAPGKDGAIQYTAGTGIEITSGNVIQATGASVATWGDIQGTLSSQTDLKNALDAKQATLTAGSNVSISAQNVISATDTTYSAFVGASSGAAGAAGLVPAPASGETAKYLKSDGNWDTISIPTVNNSTITFTNNGTTVDSFTTNAASAKTIALSAPVVTVTNTDPGAGSALAANNFVAVYGSDPIVLDYSTTEVNTGTTWVDGSPIYKKTINFGSLPDSASKNVAHGISNLGWVVKTEAISANTGKTSFIEIPFASRQLATDSIELEITTANVTITTASSWWASNNPYCYVTIYYTKTA